MRNTVYVCDRCGMPFANGKEQRDMSIKNMSRDKSGNVYSSRFLDLCPECYSALMKFLGSDSDAR